MSIIEYILLAIALAIPTAVVLRGSAQQTHIRLSQALLVVLVFGFVHAAFLVIGMYIANGLSRFSHNPESVNNLIYLGFFLIVAVKLLFAAIRQKDASVGYDISRWSTALALSVATGLNVLLIGLGLGFRTLVAIDLYKAAIPMIVSVFLLGYWAVMLGRQKKKFKERRWMLISVLFLLISAIFNVTDFL